PVQEHQCGRGAQQTEAKTRPGPRRCPEEEGNGQNAAREGQINQAGQKREREETYTK
ncbi:hypothetical protein GOODEAATRI_011224, partial [Goodea atripinnis]